MSFYFIAIFLYDILPAVLTYSINFPNLTRVFIVNICQAFALAYLFTVLGRILNKHVKNFLLIIIAVGSFLISATIIFSERPFSTETLILISQTDQREVNSFINQFITPAKIGITIVLLIFYIFSLILTIKWPGNRSLLRKEMIVKILPFILLITVIAGFTRFLMFGKIFLIKNTYDFEKWYSLPSILSDSIDHYSEYRNGDFVTSLIFAFYGYLLNTKDLPVWEKTQLALINEKFKAAPDSINIVMIIGESFIKRHSNLYGYPLVTNPFLTKEAQKGNLAVFNDFITTANYTAESLRNLLNLNDLSKGEKWNESPYFPLIISKSGWRTHLYDNQFTSPTHIADIQLSGMMRNPLLESHFYEWSNDSIDRFDGDFIDRINNKFPFDKTTGNFDIFHLYGQHFHPADRYPHEPQFNYWTGDSLPYNRPWFNDEKRDIVAQYDNATLYNDYVISKIIKRYDGTPALIIYFSDHGEEIYDASDCTVRNEPSQDIEGWLERQFEIPFFIWASDDYISGNKESWDNINLSVDKPGMLDNVGQMVLGLCNIKDNPYYRSSSDILNPGYQEKDRIVSNHFFNYDQQKKEKARKETQ